VSGSPRPALPWWHHSLLALSEGVCPEHGTALRVTGWCPACQVWWSADFTGQIVTTTYPFPQAGWYPEP
jgi:hypothetical protein